MAEERILVRKIKPECKFRAMHETTAGGHSWIDFLCCNPSIITTNRKCDDKRLEKCKCRELIGLSLQEAIERIATAMCIRDGGISCDNCIYKNSNNCKTTLENWFIEDAEAALNALLEAEK